MTTAWHSPGLRQNSDIADGRRGALVGPDGRIVKPRMSAQDGACLERTAP